MSATALPSTEYQVVNRLTMVVAAGLALGACAPERLVEPDGTVSPDFAISDGTTDGDARFFFLPPIVSDPASTGTFDADLSPVVEICEWVGGACAGPLVARFEVGGGADDIEVDDAEEHYAVQWHLRDSELSVDQVYRISVKVRGRVVGYAEVLIAANGRDARNAETLGYIGLVNNRTLPIKFRLEQGLVTKWASISGQHVTSCAVTVDSEGFCWGGTGSPTILGDGTTNPSASPVRVSGGHDFVEIEAGHLPCGITLAGVGYCWGGNLRGRVGAGSFANTLFTTPTAVVGGYQFTSIRGDHDTNCGVTVDGTGYCWGGNWAGQLGAGYVATMTEWNPSPRPVVGGLTFQSPIEQGHAHGCGVADGGGVYCWGRNESGQLGDGGIVTRGTPMLATSSETFVSVGAGQAHSCALANDGVVHCWGDNTHGQLGTGGSSSLIPALVAHGEPFTQLTVGRWHTCAKTATGEAFCWGSNANGRLGDGTTTSRGTPTPVSGGLRFQRLDAGRDHTCGVTTAGDAVCWGMGTLGQLGDGRYADSPSPVFVSEPN